MGRMLVMPVCWRSRRRRVRAGPRRDGPSTLSAIRGRSWSSWCSCRRTARSRTATHRSCSASDAAFSARGVAFWLVYPDATETPDVVRRHLADYGYRMDALRDPAHALVRRSGVRVTPGSGRLRAWRAARLSRPHRRPRRRARPVRGRRPRSTTSKTRWGPRLPDGRFARPRSPRRLLHRRSRMTARTTVMLVSPRARSLSRSRPDRARVRAPALRERHVHQDVAPILFRNCASCHRPGGAAPSAS
jgi:hypothetical protein